MPLSFAGVRMATCSSCGTTIFLDDGVASDGGPSGDMHEATLPAQLGEALIIDDFRYELVGHARFSYGPGWWDEFWALTARGDGVWISFDEGDVALQIPAEDNDPIRRIRRLPRIGESIDAWRVTEVEEATCLAVRGNFPERMRVGDSYKFANLEDGTGRIASAEVEDDGSLNWNIGRWVDRWQVKHA